MVQNNENWVCNLKHSHKETPGLNSLSVTFFHILKKIVAIL